MGELRLVKLSADRPQGGGMTLSAIAACVGGRHVSRDAKWPSVSLLPIARKLPIHDQGLLEISEAERRVIEAYIELGSREAAAAKLGRSIKTIDAHLTNARERGGFYSSMQLAIAYDRTKRQGGFE